MKLFELAFVTSVSFPFECTSLHQADQLDVAFCFADSFGFAFYFLFIDSETLLVAGAQVPSTPRPHHPLPYALLPWKSLLPTFRPLALL